MRGKDYAKGDNEGMKLDLAAGKVTPGGNWAAFIAACRAGNPQMANGNAHDAHYGCVLGHLMNNSYRLGEKVPFDVKSGRFGDNADAAEHFAKLHSIMTDGVGVPVDGNQYTVGPMLTFDPKTEKHIGDLADKANKLLKDRNRAGAKSAICHDRWRNRKRLRDWQISGIRRSDSGFVWLVLHA